MTASSSPPPCLGLACSRLWADSRPGGSDCRSRDGQVFSFEFDGLNRVAIKFAPAGGRTVRYSYDLRGLQTGAWFIDTGEGVYNGYDGFGRVASTTSTMGGVARTVGHLFDRDGRKAELTFPDGFRFWFERDGLWPAGGRSAPFPGWLAERNLGKVAESGERA